MSDDTITIKLVDFSKRPGSRYRSDGGDSSAEEFRQDHLIPAFKRAQAEGKPLVVNLDGVAGIAASFMEEAFGGLVRACGSDVPKVVRPQCIEDPQMAQEATQSMAEQVERQEARNEWTLNEFHMHQEEMLDKFHDYWLRNQGNNPDQYPATMTLSEWWEQINAFEASGCPEE